MKEKIIVVEDERIIACDIRNCLENHGYIVPAIAAYGEDAIAQTEAFSPDLILMDIMLKGSMSGVEAAQAISQKFPTPIVYLTAYSDEKTLSQAKISHPFGYILKPFEESQLLTTIEIALAKFQAELVIREELIQAQKNSALKSNFASIVSHEIRNPLNVIMTSSEILATHMSKLEVEKQAKYLQHIQKAVQQVSHLLDDVLLIGQSEVGQVKFHPIPIDIKFFCQELVTDLQISSNYSHKLILNSQGNCNYDINNNSPHLDPKLLHHILTNLLTNAMKYSPPASSIKFDVFCLQEEVIFRIQDEGIGIPMKDQEFLFQSFHRASNVGNIPGTGLGLSIVKQYVDLHQGEISVISEEGMGTTFIISIPFP